MEHWEVCELFKSWFQRQLQYEKWFLFQNNSGFDHEKNVHYGLPSCGGGADFIAFGKKQAEFFEIKTIGYPTLKKNQKTFVKNMTGQGFKCWIVKELPPDHPDGKFYVIDAKKYRPYAKCPY